ncbi:MAG: ribonuclease PH [Candidatus Coatesbacteria bacterium]|nr:ribonuclease PH [Candidatus Coatesbacteria bacterium]
MRANGRKNNEIRPVEIERAFAKYAEGSALITMGNTKVLCTATVREELPQWLRGSGQGWITSEYGMLPRSSPNRIPREASRGRITGRTHEIQRLIGRSLRAVVDLTMIKDRTIWLDCDVIQADGGTRTASVTASFVALCDALTWLGGADQGLPCLSGFVAATSVGIVSDELLLDLDYSEDSTAAVDMNIVMTDTGKFIEIQGTAEAQPFGQDSLTELISLGNHGISQLVEIQRRVLGDVSHLMAGY